MFSRSLSKTVKRSMKRSPAMAELNMYAEQFQFAKFVDGQSLEAVESVGNYTVPSNWFKSPITREFLKAVLKFNADHQGETKNSVSINGGLIYLNRNPTDKDPQVEDDRLAKGNIVHYRGSYTQELKKTNSGRFLNATYRNTPFVNLPLHILSYEDFLIKEVLKTYSGPFRAVPSDLAQVVDMSVGKDGKLTHLSVKLMSSGMQMFFDLSCSQIEFDRACWFTRNGMGYVTGQLYVDPRNVRTRVLMVVNAMPGKRPNISETEWATIAKMSGLDPTVLAATAMPNPSITDDQVRQIADKVAQLAEPVAMLVKGGPGEETPGEEEEDMGSMPPKPKRRS